MVSPACNVNSSGGTNPVPVMSTVPSGIGLSRFRYSTKSDSERRNWLKEMSSLYAALPLRSISKRMFQLEGSLASAVFHNRTGPNEQLSAKTLAWGKYNGFSPSMSRELR